MKRKSYDKSDMTRGEYRRIYGGYVNGKRINILSLPAEAWFWRVHTTADDFGNLAADPEVIFTSTVGRRVAKVRVADVTGWVQEMVAAGLLRRYEANGEQLLHVVDFVSMQPGGRNGVRVRRAPASPWDDGAQTPVNPDGTDVSGGPSESKGIPVNPSESGKSQQHHNHDHDHHHDHDHNNPATQGSGEPALRASPEPSPPFLIFETVGGRANKATTWPLTEEYVSELAEQYPAVDVRAECRRALGWTRDKAANRKTHDGMRAFLRRWVARVQDRGGSRGDVRPVVTDDDRKFNRRPLDSPEALADARAALGFTGPDTET